MDSDFLIELWETLKPYINSKDKLHAADELISMCDAHGYDEICDVVDLPADLRAAVVTHYDLDDEDDEEHEW